MVKQRLTTADVAAEVACLRRLIGMRVANVYDINPKTYVLKLARSGEDGEKALLLIESGVRLHTIPAMPEKADTPSNFTLKLRKHMRTRRLEGAVQLGVDRVVQLTFGGGEGAHHLLLEFYSQGNIILTDKSYEVLTLLRSHRDDAKGVAIMARHPYPIHTIRLRQPLAASVLNAALDGAQEAAAAAGAGGGVAAGGGETAAAAAVTEAAAGDGKTGPQQNGGEGVEGDEEDDAGESQQQPAGRQAAAPGKAAAGSAAVTLKSLLADVLPYGPLVSEHCILEAGLDPGRCLASVPLTQAERAALLAAVRAWERWLDACDSSGSGSAGSGPAPPEGYILLKEGTGSSSSSSSSIQGINGGEPQAAAGAGGGRGKGAAAPEGAVYEAFEPLLVAQHRGRPAVRFPTFDAALAEFFGKVHGQRQAVQQQAKEKAAVGKLDAIKKDHERRLQALQVEQEASERKAELIEYNLELVDAALNAVREALAGGMDWRELWRMIREERKAGNPVAALVDSLQLERGKVTLLLSNWLDGDEEGDEEAATRPATKVEMDLSLSAHANARVYYDMRRKHAAKQQKTLDANEKALKQAEKKAQQQLKQVRSAAATPAIVRKPFWFERFHWFVSSENYLVLSGRDAQQNELLVKRYLRKGDVYVHADLHGASSTIVKNHTPDSPIPPLTLSQAGQACVCRSQAWDAKVVTSAWWVHPEQVSKTAPTGEYLVTGSFMIRGKKNYLPPQPLIMGFGFMFGLAEESIAAHLGERAPRLHLGDDDAASEAAAAEAAAEEEEGAADLGNEGDEGSAEEAAGSAPRAAPQEEAGSSAGAADAGPRSALDAFLDASADVPGGLRSVTAAFERYGLSDTLEAAGAGPTGDEGEEGGEQQLGGSVGERGAEPGRRHLSAKERQLLKKQQQGGGGSAADSQQQQGQQGQQKGGAKGGAGKQAESKQQAREQQQLQQQQLQQQQLQQQQQQQAAVRGKSGKSKKARQRYADQDEQDKELAMQVLQPAGQRKDRKARKAERKERLAARQAARSSLPRQEISEADIAKLTEKVNLEESEAEEEGEGEGEEGGQQAEGHEESSGEEGAEESETEAAAAGAAGEALGSGGSSSGGEGELRQQQQQQGSAEAGEPGAADGGAGSGGGPADEPAAGGGRAAARAARKEAQRAEQAEIAALLAEENVELVAEEERERLTQLDALTGIPRSEDILLFALPVCAPYQVLTSYKYKVKLLPGTLKKGKAVRQAVELLTRGVGAEAGGGAAHAGGSSTQRERDLIRAVPEPDMITCMCGTVRLQMPGLQKAKQAAKKGRKK